METFARAAAVFLVLAAAALSPFAVGAWPLAAPAVAEPALREHSVPPAGGSATGRPWTSAPDLAFQGGLAIGDGALYATGQGGRLAALDPRTGKRRWATPAIGNEQLNSPPAETDRVVAYYDLVQALVNGLDAGNGTFLWARQVGSGLSSRGPLARAGSIYVTTDQPSQLVALAAGTGEVRWTAATHGLSDAVPVLYAGTVYTVTDRLYAFDAATGARRWSAAVPDRFVSPPRGASGSPAVDDRAVYVTGADGVVHAFDRRTGARLWSTPIGSGSIADTAVAGGVVVAVNDVGGLYGLDGGTGRALWRRHLDRSGSSPSAARGFAYVGDGLRVKAVSLLDGTVRATFPAVDGCAVYEPPSVVAGTVYFVGCRVQAALAPPPSTSARW